MTEPGQPGYTGEPEAAPEAAAEPAEKEDGGTPVYQPLTTPPAQLAVPPGMVRLKVQPPHSHFGFGGVWVDDEGSVVPQSALGGLMEAAANAGVTLTQEEG